MRQKRQISESQEAIGEGLLIKKGEVIRKMPEDQLLSVLREELLNWEKKQES